MRILALLLPLLVPDHNYVRAKIYVADHPAPAELRAAANIAARLAFEAASMDLPVGFPISKYSTADSSVAIVVGTAAARFGTGRIVETTDGGRKVIAIGSLEDADTFAVTLSAEPLKAGARPLEERLQPKDYSLSRLFAPEGLLGDASRNLVPDRTDTTIVLGPDVHSIEVIDLAARIGMETTGLRLPLVKVAGAEPEKERLQNPVLVGLSNQIGRASCRERV